MDDSLNTLLGERFMWADNRLTRFEKARIIGARALQIAYGSPTTIETPEGMMDPIEIAKLEFQEGRIPVEIVRTVAGTQVRVDPNTAID